MQLVRVHMGFLSVGRRDIKDIFQFLIEVGRLGANITDVHVNLPAFPLASWAACSLLAVGQGFLFIDDTAIVRWSSQAVPPTRHVAPMPSAEGLQRGKSSPQKLPAAM